MKNTKQKELILDAVFGLRTHPTADEIYSQLKKENERLSLGTVYRNLSRFAEEGKIKKIPVPNQCDRFDYRTDSHEHIICEGCGKLYDLEVKVDMKDFLPPGSEFKPTGYRFIMYALCPSCQENVVEY